MDVRYSAQNNNGVDLVLTDCPSANSTNEMAYKSQLLAWHAEDTVSDEERMRNRRVCERWQGNRNVFVDFPDAARRIFGEPRLPIGDGLGYAECTAA
jgi:endonuclease I